MRERPANAGDRTFEGGELLVAGFDGSGPSDEIAELILRHRLGGVILYGKNCEDPSQVRAMTEELQCLARAGGQDIPLLVAVDQEQGRVVRLREGITLFPAMGELGSLGDAPLTERVSAAVARELLAVGINWNLAPVADVSANRSSAPGDRSFGDDPSVVAAMVAAWVRGSESVGLAGCLKHFPGHGSTAADSHYTSPLVRKSLESLKAVDLPPFASGVAAGASAVMTAHITFTALDSSRPATFSAAAVDGLLRGGLGFEGVVVSDDLEMAGSSERLPLPEGSVAALRAGVDLLLVSRMFQPDLDLSRYVAELGERLRAGDVPPARLTAARRRIRALRERCRRRDEGGDGGALRILRCPEHTALREEVMERLSRRGRRA